MRAPAVPVVLAVAALGLAFWTWRRGGVAAVASDAGAAVVNAAGGAVSGAVGAIGSAVGLPTPADTTTDPAVARWLIDHQGWVTASQWAGLPALWQAAQMDAGTGTPPPAGSAVARAFSTSITPPQPWAGLYAPLPDGASFLDLQTTNPVDRILAP